MFGRLQLHEVNYNHFQFVLKKKTQKQKQTISQLLVTTSKGWLGGNNK